jgi:hypothetical protein
MVTLYSPLLFIIQTVPAAGEQVKFREGPWIEYMLRTMEIRLGLNTFDMDFSEFSLAVKSKC